MKTPKPRTADYCTNDGMHAAMRSWARDNQRFVLEVTAVLGDGSLFCTAFERATRQEPYRTPDGLTWTEDVDTGRFRNTVPDVLDATLSEHELKNAFEAWIRRATSKVESITWKRVYPQRPVCTDTNPQRSSTHETK